jgi:flagellum-specific ATP synthase
MNVFAKEMERIERITTPALAGNVVDVTGLTATISGLPAPVGSMCSIECKSGELVEAQVVGFKDEHTVVMPLKEVMGVSRGDRVTTLTGEARVGVCDQLTGRVLDGMGRVIDNGPPLYFDQYYSLYQQAPRALERPRITAPLSTGIRAIDSMLTAGRGQRLGLFAGTGVGKSVLMGMIARYTDADVTVVALVGERGREVNEFIEKDLGPEGRKKTVMVLSTSDESPVLRVQAAFVATAVAEYFRDRGKNVLLLMDSLTRTARAQRQIGLAAGEPPTTKGYTPSSFALLPQLLERAGQTSAGSITGFYTVLVEADDINDPVGDAVRGVLDGHIWLSRTLASQAHYPAISIPDSISRVMSDIVDDEHLQASRVIMRALAQYAEIEDLVNIGAYASGSNPTYDAVIQTRQAVLDFLRQEINKGVSFDQAREQLVQVAEDLEETVRRLQGQKGSRPATQVAKA